MKIVQQSHEILYFSAEAEKMIELAGRTCYKSEDKITDKSAARFVRGIVKSGHHSVIEHAFATVRFITNRGVTHELVRHRLCSFSQESSRYVNYGGGPMEIIEPVWADEVKDSKDLGKVNAMVTFHLACSQAEKVYNFLLKSGWKPEQAREVLPNALKTEIVVTANFREWLHIFKLRTAPAAHPQIRALMRSCAGEFAKKAPTVFGVFKEFS